MYEIDDIVDPDIQSMNSLMKDVNFSQQINLNPQNQNFKYI